MRVVLDTNVVVSAYLSSRGAPARILRTLHDEAFDLIVSPALLLEYETALAYPKVRRLHKLTDEEIRREVGRLSAVAVLVMPSTVPAVAVSDPDDNILFACAIAGRAEVIVSGDAHVQAVKRYLDVEVLSPPQFIIALARMGYTD